MRRSSLVLGSISALAMLLSCVDGDRAIAPAPGGTVRVPLSAQVTASAADASAHPINRIRAIGRAVPGGEVLGETTVTVDPTADVWDVPLELTLEGLLVQVMIELSLIHVDATGTEHIEYSGRVGPLAVRPGVETPATDVTVVRGPPANLGVTAIDITNTTPALMEGGSRTLQAAVTTSTPGNAPTVFWTSLTPTVLSLNGAIATALLPGTARVVATAGPVSDTADIQIVQRPAGVTISPSSVTLDLGGEATFTGAVVDPRGAPIAGQAVLWRSLDPSVLEALTGGRFRAIGSGTGRAEVRAAADTTLKAVATARIARRPADVAITKSAGATTAFVGDAVVFTVAAANQGDVDAVNVRVRDALPAGLTLESTLASAGAYDAATGTWTVGTLAPGARATLELRTRVASGSPGSTITNTAERVASEDQTDPNAANDRASASFTIGERLADVSVQKSASRASIAENDTVTFVVTAANNGTQSIANLAVADSLPSGLTIVSDAPTRGNFDRTLRSWAVGTLAPGESARLTIVARAAAGTAGSTQTNVARILGYDGPRDPQPANDRATASVGVVPVATPGNQADVAVTKTIAAASLLEGDTATFTVKVKNLGPQPALGVAVKDSLGAGLTYVAATPNQGTFASGTMTWTLGTLAVGDSAMMSVRARVNTGTTGQTLTNTARYLPGTTPDAVAGNNSATASVAVQPSQNQADVAVTKTVAVASLLEGDTARFTVKVKNQGPATAANVQVKDSLGAGLIFAVVSPAYDSSAAGGMFFTLGSLAPGDSVLISLSARVNSGTTGQTLYNTARYLATGTADPASGNNTATAAVTVVPRSANVEVVKVVDVSTPAELAPIRYTVTTTNLGPNDVTNLRIKDRLPTGLTLDSVRSATGTIAGDTLWTIPTLAVSSSAVMYVYARVNDGTGGSTIVNQASKVGMDQSDPTTGNDVGSATVTVQQRRLDLEVRKTMSVAQPTVLTTFFYRVTVKNRGPGTATNVVVADTLPAQLTVDSVRTTAGSYAGPTWTVPTLAQGDSAMLTAYMRVPQASSGQTITNRARRVSQTQLDTLASNDLATVTHQIPINNPPVLTITAPPNQAVFDPGDTITFTATASDQEDGPLTTSIQWTSNVNGAIGTGGTISRSNLSPGPHNVIASVTDSNGNVAADTVPIVIAIVTTPTTLNVPFGGTASLPISLSAPAPSGGLTLTITTADASKVGVVTSSVTIPAGQLSANAQLSGVQPGSAVVTASTNGFGSSSTNVSVTAALNLVSNGNPISFHQFPRGYTSTIQVRLESQGTQIAAPSGGVVVTLSSASPSCLAATSPVTIPAGQTQASTTLSYGGDSGSPCSSYLRASATSITPDSINVTVNPTPGINLFQPGNVGSGLQVSTSGSLDYSQHGGVTIRVASTNPQVLLISPNSTTAGAAFVDIPLANGNSSFSYYVQAVEGATGAVPVIASGGAFLPDTLVVTAVQPAVRVIVGGSSNQTTFSPNQSAYAYVGIPDCCGFVSGQNVRAGGNPLTATFTVSDSIPARLVNSTTSGRTLTATVPVGQQNSPTTVAQGGVAIDFLAAGTTTLNVSIPGFTTVTASAVTFTISAPGIQVGQPTLGAGLQTAANATLGASGHPGVTVRVASSDTTRLLISPNATTAGSGFIDVFVPTGQQFVNYYVQGVEGTTGTPRVRVSAPGFVSDSATISVVQPAIRIGNLSTQYTSQTADQPFYAYVGYPDCCGGVSLQNVRFGGQPVVVTFNSTDSTKARLVTSSSSGATVTATIPVNSYFTPTSVAAGGVALDLLAAGSTTVTVTAPGFARATSGTVNVTVTAPSFNISNSTVGASLQTGAFASMTAPAVGATTVRLVSSDSSRILLSPNATTAGTGTIDVVVPDGQTGVSYYVQGVEGQTGTSLIRITAPGFTADSATATVQQSHVMIYGLPSNTTTLSNSTAFYAAVGLPDCCGGVNAQNVRAGGSPLTVTVTSSNQGVGQLTTTAGTFGTVTLTIPIGQYYTPTNVASGGVAFDPVGAGTTTVSATIPGFQQRPGANLAVTVTSPGISVSSGTVGGGLMVTGSINLGAPAPAGITLRIRSSSGAVAKVAPNATTAGADSIDIAVPTGSSFISFYVHGVQGATGTVTISASAPGYTDGSGAWNVVQPAVILQSLSSSYSAAAADDLFSVVVGVPSGTSLNSQTRQFGAAPLQATVVSSQPTVGTLVTSAGAAPTRTVNVNAGSSSSPGSIGAGGIAFDPLSPGSTTVSVTIPGFISQPAATVNVTVNP